LFSNIGFGLAELSAEAAKDAAFVADSGSGFVASLSVAITAVCSGRMSVVLPFVSFPLDSGCAAGGATAAESLAFDFSGSLIAPELRANPPAGNGVGLVGGATGADCAAAAGGRIGAA
jgi:hypothetical protein